MGTVSRQEAIKMVAKLEQPIGIRHDAWLRIKRLLKELCQFLPNPYPGTRLLAKRTGISWVATKRLLARAEALGLLVRTSRPIHGHRDGYTYRLAFLDGSGPDWYGPLIGPLSTGSGPEEELRSSSPPTEETPSSGRRMAPPAAAQGSRLTNRWVAMCAVCRTEVWPHSGVLHGRLPVHSFCDDGTTDWEAWRAYMSDYHARRDAERQAAADMGAPGYGDIPESEEELTVIPVRPANPAAGLAYSFEAAWRRGSPRWYPDKDIRWGHTGAAIVYIRNTFLTKGYSPEHVQAYFDAFFTELFDESNDIVIREGSTPWQRFTSWWGTTPVPDPAIARGRREEVERIKTAARTITSVRLANKEAAWERIEAAQARGERPSDEDWEAAGLPPRRRSLS